MVASVVRFCSLFLVALLVGTMFGVWVGFNPAALTGPAYVEMQQNSIRALNVFMPVLGAVCIVLIVLLAFLSKYDSTTRYLLLAAAVCLVAAGLITRFGNQPINAVVMTWSPQAPAADWTQLRDTWWKWHIVRTVLALAALALALLANLRGGRGFHATQVNPPPPR